MFLVNSRLGLFTATLSCSTSKSLHTTRVPLLPKLRGDFAEFLSESCLAHLSILYQPTSVYNEIADFPTISAYTLKQSLPIDCVPILLRPSATDNDYQVVQEYQPDVHRLRRSASS